MVRLHDFLLGCINSFNFLYDVWPELVSSFHVFARTLQWHFTWGTTGRMTDWPSPLAATRVAHLIHALSRKFGFQMCSLSIPNAHLFTIRPWKTSCLEFFLMATFSTVSGKEGPSMWRLTGIWVTAFWSDFHFKTTVLFLSLVFGITEKKSVYIFLFAYLRPSIIFVNVVNAKLLYHVDIHQTLLCFAGSLWQRSVQWTLAVSLWTHRTAP